MSWTTVKDAINAAILTNGANAITAAVLNPILIAIAEQAEAQIGDLTALSTTDKGSLVAAVNEVFTGIGSGQKIYTGTADPNDTPPLVFAQGDYYNQTAAAVTIAFWQYNGLKWTQTIGAEASKVSPITTASGNYTVLAVDKVIIYTGTLISDEIAIPAANVSLDRVLQVVNRSSNEINFNASFLDYTGASITTIPANSKREIVSDGTNWNLT